MVKIATALLLVLSITGCTVADFFEVPPDPVKCKDEWIHDPRIKRT